jgi:uncharacterized protein (TIGR02246 family)
MRLTTRTVLVTLFIVLTVSCESSQVDVALETDAVRARSEAAVAAEAAKDLETALSFWADDAIVQTFGSPQIQGKKAVAGLMEAFFAQVKDFEGASSHIEVSTAGDLAFEYGVNRVVIPGPEGDLLAMGKYLMIWKKMEGEWYISAISFTDDAPAPIPLSN